MEWILAVIAISGYIMNGMEKYRELSYISWLIVNLYMLRVSYLNGDNVAFSIFMLYSIMSIYNFLKLKYGFQRIKKVLPLHKLKKIL